MGVVGWTVLVIVHCSLSAILQGTRSKIKQTLLTVRL